MGNRRLLIKFAALSCLAFGPFFLRVGGELICMAESVISHLVLCTVEMLNRLLL